MKKLLSVWLTFIIGTGLSCFANGIEIQPTMQTKTNAQDRVWVGTFQIVWNDFIDRVIFNPIRFREGTPAIVYDLNKKEFNTNDISDKSYYKYAGKVTKNTKKQITKAIKKKFGESSELLDKLVLSPRNDNLLIYAMLNKNFEFVKEFNKLGVSEFGNNQSAEYFGISNKSDKNLGNGVVVLFYNSPEDCAVKLTTKSNDELFIYKNSSNKAFNYIYDDMIKKQNSYNGGYVFQSEDELKIPKIKFFAEKSFDELTGKRIMGTNYVISQALETVKFEMNNKGVKLKSEAAMSVMTTALMPEVQPRYFYFDDTFVIFLKEKGKNTPYFALRINDISKFQE